MSSLLNLRGKKNVMFSSSGVMTSTEESDIRWVCVVLLHLVRLLAVMLMHVNHLLLPAFGTVNTKLQHLLVK